MTATLQTKRPLHVSMKPTNSASVCVRTPEPETRSPCVSTVRHDFYCQMTDGFQVSNMA